MGKNLYEDMEQDYEQSGMAKRKRANDQYTANVAKNFAGNAAYNYIDKRTNYNLSQTRANIENKIFDVNKSISDKINEQKEKLQDNFNNLKADTINKSKDLKEKYLDPAANRLKEGYENSAFNKKIAEPAADAIKKKKDQLQNSKAGQAVNSAVQKTGEATGKAAAKVGQAAGQAAGAAGKAAAVAKKAVQVKKAVKATTTLLKVKMYFIIGAVLLFFICLVGIIGTLFPNMLTNDGMADFDGPVALSSMLYKRSSAKYALKTMINDNPEMVWITSNNAAAQRQYLIDVGAMDASGKRVNKDKNSGNAYGPLPEDDEKMAIGKEMVGGKEMLKYNTDVIIAYKEASDQSEEVAVLPPGTKVEQVGAYKEGDPFVCIKLHKQKRLTQEEMNKLSEEIYKKDGISDEGVRKFETENVYVKSQYLFKYPMPNVYSEYTAQDEYKVMGTVLKEVLNKGASKQGQEKDVTQKKAKENPEYNAFGIFMDGFTDTESMNDKITLTDGKLTIFVGDSHKEPFIDMPGFKPDYRGENVFSAPELDISGQKMNQDLRQRSSDISRRVARIIAAYTVSKGDSTPSGGYYDTLDRSMKAALKESYKYSFQIVPMQKMRVVSLIASGKTTKVPVVQKGKYIIEKYENKPELNQWPRYKEMELPGFEDGKSYAGGVDEMVKGYVRDPQGEWVIKGLDTTGKVTEEKTVFIDGTVNFTGPTAIKKIYEYTSYQLEESSTGFNQTLLEYQFFFGDQDGKNLWDFFTKNSPNLYDELTDKVKKKFKEDNADRIEELRKDASLWEKLIDVATGKLDDKLLNQYFMPDLLNILYQHEYYNATAGYIYKSDDIRQRVVEGDTLGIYYAPDGTYWVPVRKDDPMINVRETREITQDILDSILPPEQRKRYPYKAEDYMLVRHDIKVPMMNANDIWGNFFGKRYIVQKESNINNVIEAIKDGNIGQRLFGFMYYVKGYTLEDTPETNNDDVVDTLKNEHSFIQRYKTIEEKIEEFQDNILTFLKPVDFNCMGSQTANKSLAEIARAEVSTTHGDKYRKWAGMTGENDPAKDPTFGNWSAVFANWVLSEAGGKSMKGQMEGNEWIPANYPAHYGDKYHPADGVYEPHPGDFALTKDKSRLEIVIEYDKASKKVVTVSGNNESKKIENNMDVGIVAEHSFDLQQYDGFCENNYTDNRSGQISSASSPTGEYFDDSGLDPRDPDYRKLPGAPATPYDSPYPVYMQSEGPWADYPYLGNETIALAGCGLVSYCVIIAGYGDRSVIDREYPEHGLSPMYFVENYPEDMTEEGTTWALYGKTAEKFGMKVEQREPISQAELDEYLKKGNPVLFVVGGKSIFTDFGHFMAIVGIAPDGKYILRNSANRMHNFQTWDYETLFTDCKQVWIFSEGKLGGSGGFSRDCANGNIVDMIFDILVQTLGSSADSYRYFPDRGRIQAGYAFHENNPSYAQLQKTHVLLKKIREAAKTKVDALLNGEPVNKPVVESDNPVPQPQTTTTPGAPEAPPPNYNAAQLIPYLELESNFNRQDIADTMEKQYKNSYIDSMKEAIIAILKLPESEAEQKKIIKAEITEKLKTVTQIRFQKDVGNDRASKMGINLMDVKFEAPASSAPNLPKSEPSEDGSKAPADGVIDYNLPRKDLGETKTYMGYTAIKDESTTQYKLQNDDPTRVRTGDHFIRMYDDKYMVAVAPRFGKPGDSITVTFGGNEKGPGQTIDCIIGDQKQYGELDEKYRMYHEHDGSVIEFIVDEDAKNASDEKNLNFHEFLFYGPVTDIKPGSGIRDFKKATGNFSKKSLAFLVLIDMLNDTVGAYGTLEEPNFREIVNIALSQSDGFDKLHDIMNEQYFDVYYSGLEETVDVPPILQLSNFKGTNHKPVEIENEYKLTPANKEDRALLTELLGYMKTMEDIMIGIDEAKFENTGNKSGSSKNGKKYTIDDTTPTSGPYHDGITEYDLIVAVIAAETSASSPEGVEHVIATIFNRADNNHGLTDENDRNGDGEMSPYEILIASGQYEAYSNRSYMRHIGNSYPVIDKCLQEAMDGFRANDMLFYYAEYLFNDVGGAAYVERMELHDGNMFFVPTSDFPFN